MQQLLNRRRILKTAAAAPWVVPAIALGKDGAAAASDRVTLGFIGVGMMGRGHLRHLVQYPGAQVLAVCDVDRWRRENAQRTVEEGYAVLRPGVPHACADYNDFRALLDRADVDAVVVATGDNWHGVASIMACKAGKDVYCEKPISKTIHEARAMAEAGRRYGRVFQIGLQQRSTPEFCRASELVRAGRIGPVKIVYVAFPGTNGDVNLPAEPVPDGLDWDLWLGPAPWRSFNSRFHSYGPPPRVVPWHFCSDFGGGNLTSNTVHAFDVVQWALGMDESGPRKIVPPETGLVPSLTYEYSDGVLLQVVDWRLDPAHHFVPEGWNPATRLQNFGALYVGRDGWIHVGREGFLESHPKEIVAEKPDAPPSSSVSNHHQNWLDSIRSRQKPACDVAVGCRSTIVSHLGCIAHWTGRALEWDPVAEEFVGDDEANRLRFRALRAPWRI